MIPPIGVPNSIYQRDLMSRPVFNARNCSKAVRGRGHIQKLHVINIYKVFF